MQQMFHRLMESKKKKSSHFRYFFPNVNVDMWCARHVCVFFKGLHWGHSCRALDFGIHLSDEIPFIENIYFFA